MSLAQVTTRAHCTNRASRSQARPFRGHLPETPGDSQHSFSQRFSASYAPYPHKAEPPRKQSPLGNEFLGPFCRFAHGVFHNQGAVPPLTISGCSPLFTLTRTGGSSSNPYCQSCHSHMVYQCQPRGGVPQECPPTSSINTVSPPSVNKWYDHQPGGFLLPPSAKLLLRYVSS